MTTIHLTDAQRDAFAACGLIVIDGDICPTCHGYPNDVTLDDDCNITAITPKSCCVAGGGLVAPEGWRILTEPCDTCKGNGLLMCEHEDECPLDCWMTKDCPNPDCVGGRRVVTLTATCPECAGDYESTGYGKFIACDDGVVTLGRFTIPPLLPVVGNERTPRPPEYVWIPGDGSLQLAVIGRMPMFTPLPSLDPMPRPGQFIAKVEPVA